MARLSALFIRLSLVLTILLSSVVGQSTLLKAQTAPPNVNFSPSSVPFQGHINISGNYYGCPQTIELRVLNERGGIVDRLGNLEVCRSFETDARLPATVVP